MISKKTSAFIVAMFLTQICMAGFWETVKFWESPKRPETVVITGNFVKSRLLAEMIQNKEDCPLLLFSPESEKAGGHFYHLPNGKAAAAEKMTSLVQFLKFMNPKSVVVIGDEKYIGQTCATILTRCTVPVTYFRNSSNWASNANDAGKFFKISDLGKDYVTAISQVDERGNRIPQRATLPVVKNRSNDPLLHQMEATQSKPVMTAPQVNVSQNITQKANLNAHMKTTKNPDMNEVMEIDMEEPEITAKVAAKGTDVTPEIDVKASGGAPQIIQQGTGK